MTELWSLTIAFRGVNTTLRLLYRRGEDARAAYEALKRSPEEAFEMERGLAPSGETSNVEITDGYGTTVTVDRTMVMMHWMTDLGANLEGEKENQMLNAHAQASLQRRIAADPLLSGPRAPAVQSFGGRPS